MSLAGVGAALSPPSADFASSGFCWEFWAWAEGFAASDDSDHEAGCSLVVAAGAGSFPGPAEGTPTSGWSFVDMSGGM